MNLLKVTKDEVLDAFVDAREMGKEQNGLVISTVLMIPLNEKSSEGYRYIGCLLLDENDKPIGKIVNRITKMTGISPDDYINLLPCGLYALKMKENSWWGIKND